MHTDLKRGQRHTLPNRRVSGTEKVKLGRRSVFITIGHYPDGSPGELFLDVAKEGSDLRSLMQALAISISIALQYGAPASEIVEAFRDFEELEIPRAIANRLAEPNP